MAKNNVGRDIAVILGLAVVLGGGFAAYLLQSIEPPAPIALVPPSERSSETMGAQPHADEVRQVAKDWGERLARGDDSGALSLMAVGFRQRFSAQTLREALKRDPYLASVEKVTILRTTENRVSNSPSTFRGNGVLTSRAGAVEITLHLVREETRLRIVSVLVAGVPVLAP